MCYTPPGKSLPVILDQTPGYCELLLPGDGMHINLIECFDVLKDFMY